MPALVDVLVRIDRADEDALPFCRSYITVNLSTIFLTLSGSFRSSRFMYFLTSAACLSTSRLLKLSGNW